MIAFINGIFHELSGRVQKMLEDLHGRQSTSEVPKPFFQKTLSLLSELSKDVIAILISQDLTYEEFASNHLIKYNTLHERFLAIELYRYQAIVHYNKSEKYFNALIARIYEEVNCLQSAPLVACISNSDNYYWVYPIYDIIAVPFGEEKNLLNLPDIFHEIGHLLCGQYIVFFKGQGKIDKALEEYFTVEIRNIELENRDKSRIPELKKTFEYWKDSWIEEFICDLVATYLTGPAYAWTNFKIASISNSDKGIFSFSSEHPSDERRMYAIIKMLEKMGYKHEVETLKSSWQNFLVICTNTRNPLYNLFLPVDIIDKLVDTVIDACNNIALVSCVEQSKNNGDPVSKLLNQAWIENLTQPKTFSDWEHAQIKGLNDALLVNG